MPLAAPILQTTLDGRQPDRQGKVRDIFEFGDRLLIVASDRISAFDYVLGSGIPDKGKVLTQISAFWFDRTRSVVRNHVVATDPADYPASLRRDADALRGRSMLVMSRAGIYPVPAGRTTARAANYAAFVSLRASENRIGCRNRSSRPRQKRRADTTSTSARSRPPISSVDPISSACAI